MVKRTASDRYHWYGYGLIVLILHMLGFICLLISARSHSMLLGMGILVYTLGLRHAFDVDHIAAIDNTVRKLVEKDQNPMGVGFFFSLGHSTVVCIMALITAFAVKWAQREIPRMQEIGGIIGTTISGSFLLLIGILNLFILINIFQIFLRMRRESFQPEEIETLLLSRGTIVRFIQPLFRLVSKSWHVYPIGFLFGLGFDTASEVALLAVSAGAAKSQIPLIGMLALPVLFAAGMSLLDTADGVFMTTAYRWAFSTPVRKVYYNLTITALAVLAALLIGFIELAQVFIPYLGLTSDFWKWLQSINFNSLGYVLVLLFVATWAVSYGTWRFFRIEERWSSS